MRKKLYTVEVLRGLAATLVAGLHMRTVTTSEGLDWVFADIFKHGEIGVDIFFVISGFIIYYVSSGPRQPTVRQFAENRFWRIMPPYWAILLFYLSLTVLLAVFLGDSSKLPDLGTVLKSFVLWPMGPLHYVLGVAWTLAQEILFYIVFAITFLCFGFRVFVLTMLTWYVAGLLGMVIAQDLSGQAYPVINPIVGEFLLGAGIAWLFKQGKTRFHVPMFLLGLGLLVSLLAGVVEPHGWMRREIVYGIPCAILVYGAVGVDWKWPAWMVLWGECSYILYLIHYPLYSFVARGLEEVTGFDIYLSNLGSTLTLLFAILISALLTLKLERPYQQWYKAHIRNRKASPRAASAMRP